jgi:hypothetical protein
MRSILGASWRRVVPERGGTLHHSGVLMLRD